MKNLYQPLFVVVILLSVAGCISQGAQSIQNESADSLGSKIVTGSTSKAELLSVFGAPTNTTFTDGGLEIMTYEFTRLKPRARNFIPYNVLSTVDDGVRKELVILLAEDNTVRKYVLNEAEIQVRAGIFE